MRRARGTIFFTIENRSKPARWGNLKACNWRLGKAKPRLRNRLSSLYQGVQTGSIVSAFMVSQAASISSRFSGIVSARLLDSPTSSASRCLAWASLHSLGNQVRRIPNHRQREARCSLFRSRNDQFGIKCVAETRILGIERDTCLDPLCRYT